MIGCVYNTDSEWFNYLNDHNIVDEVNFWRKDKRKLNLPQGSFFFFKLRGTRKIVGRARFQEIKLMSVTEAWQTFGTKNGVAGKSIFENKLVEVLDINTVSENTEINCIILSDLEFLSENQIFEIDQQMFPPSILASKFFKGQDLEWLNSHFINVKKN